MRVIRGCCRLQRSALFFCNCQRYTVNLCTKNLISSHRCLDSGLSSGAGSIEWSEASGKIIPLIIILIVLYILSIISMTIYTQLMAVITQGFLSKLRCRMFDGMQNLPIGYFDTHKHGDIMSYYTNDIDTLRQLVSQSLPQLLQSIVIVASVLGIMLWYSIWMTLVVAVGVAAMIFVSWKDRRKLCKILHTSAAFNWKCRRLYPGDDERSEGHQGFFS